MCVVSKRLNSVICCGETGIVRFLFKLQTESTFMFYYLDVNYPVERIFSQLSHCKNGHIPTVPLQLWSYLSHGFRAMFLIAKSRKVSKSRDLYLELYDRFDIWQAPRQQCCRGACQISKRWDNSNYQSCVFETSRDLTIRRFIRYWKGNQYVIPVSPGHQ